MVFSDNRYTRIYNALVENARSRMLEGYTEKHHIVPRALGGTDDPHNIVALTAREHFVVHRLLVRMTHGQARYKMISALWAMCNLRSKFHSRHTPTARQYATAREMWREKMSIVLKGTMKTDDHKAKIGAKHRGKVLSEDTRRKISETRKARGHKPVHTEATRASLSSKTTGAGNPAARRCVFRDVEYGCVKDASLANDMTQWFVKKDPSFRYL